MNRLQILRAYLEQIERGLDHSHTITEWAALLRKAWPRSYGDRPLGERTLLPPGERVEVYRQRFSAGLAIFHPDDDWVQLED